MKQLRNGKAVPRLVPGTCTSPLRETKTGERGDRLRQPAQQCIEHVQTPLMTQARFTVTMVTYGRARHAKSQKVLQCGGRTFNHKGCAERAGRKRRKTGSCTFSRSAAALATCLPVSHSRAGLELRRKGKARERGGAEGETRLGCANLHSGSLPSPILD